MRHVHLHPKRTSILYAIYFIGFVFTLEYALPIYINSSFLNQFMSDQAVGWVYTVTSALTIVGLSYIGYFLRKFGNYKTAITLILLQLVALDGLIFSHNIYWIIVFFATNLVFASLTSFSIDIFLEAHSDNNHTGGIRGLFMTVLNIAWVLSPMIAGALLTTGDYWKIYTASLGLLFPLIFLLYRNFRHFEDPQYQKTSLRTTIRKMWGNKDFYNLSIANIILNVFYGWMAIYTPLYLYRHVGFSWETIGIIFTFMLLPFVLFELPAGKLADSRWGEKEIMSTGFAIIGVSTMMLTFIPDASVFLWSLLLFVSRIGASLAEVSIEIYFFKRIHTTDDNILSAFRITRPFASIVAPLITIVGLYIVDYKYLFVVLGLITIYALNYTLRIHDTK